MNIFCLIFFSLLLIFYLAFLFIFRKSTPVSAALDLFHKRLHVKQKPYHYRVISMFLITTPVICVIGILVSIAALNTTPVKISSVLRPEPDMGDSTLKVITKGDIYNGELDINVAKREYTFDEVMTIFEKCRSDFDKKVLGDNISFLQVTSPLNLPSSIDDYNISVSWKISDTDIIDYNGCPVWENIPPDGVHTSLKATLSLQDHQAGITYDIIVYPKPVNTKDNLQSQINSSINSPDTINDSRVSLPEILSGKEIEFYQAKEGFPPISTDYNSFCPTIFTYCT